MERNFATIRKHQCLGREAAARWHALNDLAGMSPIAWDAKRYRDVVRCVLVHPFILAGGELKIQRTDGFARQNVFDVQKNAIAAVDW